jgi:hypothetical protein
VLHQPTRLPSGGSGPGPSGWVPQSHCRQQGDTQAHMRTHAGEGQVEDRDALPTDRCKCRSVLQQQVSLVCRRMACSVEAQDMRDIRLASRRRA